MNTSSAFLKMLGIPYDGQSFAFEGICQDTRLLQKGDIFFDLAGNIENCEKAVTLGASAIVSLMKTPASVTVPFMTVSNVRSVFSKACGIFYPRQPETIAAVTGTNGKTSTVDFIRQLWASINLPSVSYGTLGLQGSGADKVSKSLNLPSGLNTLDAYHYHRLLEALALNNLQTHFAFEASSHGLDQHRIDNVRVKYAVFTNLTQDHLDYHHTMDQYFEAKARLFLEILDAHGTAIINRDDAYGLKLMAMCRQKELRTVTYSLRDTKADLYARIRQVHTKGMTVYLRAFDAAITINIPVVGLFQIENILAAVAVLLASTPCRLEDLIPRLTSLKSPMGRMEHVGTSTLSDGSEGGDIFVDYAHTPDALLRALQSLRSHTHGRIHIVVGCGGDRDRTKRQHMGEIAAKHADVVMITDDNPRTENAADIRAEVMEGCRRVTSMAMNRGNREEAILTSIQGLEKGDILLIAGKGHEQGQIIGNTVLPFCDKQVSEKYINDSRKIMKESAA